MIDAIQPLCESALKSFFDPIGIEVTVDRLAEHRINDDTATRSVTWMADNEDGTEFRMDCVLRDGEKIPVIWLLDTMTDDMRKLELQLVPTPAKKPEKKPETTQEIEQPETVGWRSWFWR